MNFNGFAPSSIEINNLAIGLTAYSNIDKLDFNNNEYLVIGEQYGVYNTTKDIKYTMIVNRDGVAINTTRRKVDATNDASSIRNAGLYVDDNIICEGNIIARGLEFANIKLDGVNSNLLQDLLTGISKFDPLFKKGYSVSKNTSLSVPAVDNIVTTSYINIGNISDTYNNTNPLNIASTTDHNVNNLHLSIGNKITNDYNEPAKLRIGMVGNNPYSPAVLTTTKGMPLHFHIGLNSSEINNLYSNKDGFPNFINNSNLIPSISIDEKGNVGIGTSQTDTITFTKYVKLNNLYTIEKTVTETSKLKLLGNAYIDNIITYDYFTQSNLHLDDIYVRKLGLTFDVNQIKPGEFNKGNFIFNSNLYIGHDGDKYTLEVNDKILIKGDLNVTSNAYINHIDINTAIFNNDITFDADVHINNDVILGGNITINEGDLYLGNTRINIATLRPIMISEEIANASNINGSNILFFANNDMINLSDGSNLVVPGRAGIGILTSNEYNEQFNIIKRTPNRFELLLQDSSYENTKTHIPMTYIGHLGGLDKINTISDNSFIINTNHIDELHNIYFLPGIDLNRNNLKNLVPTLTIHQNNRIGINVINPRYSLEINGEMLCNDIYINRNNEQNKALLFIQKKNNNSISGDYSKDFYYLYDEKGIDKYCINFGIDTNITLKGFNVKGGIHSVTDGYYENNIKLATLKIIDSGTETKAYTNQNLSIGYLSGDIDIGDKPLNIRNLSTSDYNDTIIRLYRGNRRGGEKNNAKFTGIDICDYITPTYTTKKNLNKWFMYKNHMLEREDLSVGPLTFGYTNNTQHPTHYGMAMYFNKQNSNYYIDINNPNIENIDNLEKKSALTVYGDLEVRGNINIVGSNHYKIDGISISSNALANLYPNLPNPNNNIYDNNNSGYSEQLNDVVITGKKIALLPSKTLAIGHLDNGFVNYLKDIGKDTKLYDIPLTVYNNNNLNPIVRFLASENITNIKNSASIEIGVFNTTYNNFEGLKKNTAQIKVSNYGPDSKKSVIDILAYNNITNFNDKVMSIYHDCYSSYVNIGYGNSIHEQASGIVNIGELNNVSLHVENISKYLLQLTNYSVPPAINMHKAGSYINKFWTIEAPDDNGNFNIKHSFSSNSYIPENSNTESVLVITENNNIGINNQNPQYSLDIKGKYNDTSLSITNTYTNITENSDSYSIINIVNSNLEHNDLTNYIINNNLSSNLYNYNQILNTYFSGFKYYIDSSNYPNTDINGNYILPEITNNSNFIKKSYKSINNIIEISQFHDIIITSNNMFLNISCNPYATNIITDNTSTIKKYVNVTLKNNNISILPNVYTTSNPYIIINSDQIYSNNILLTNNFEKQQEINNSLIPTKVTYIYDIDYKLLLSNSNYYNYKIYEPIINILPLTNNKVPIYTSNLIETKFNFNPNIPDNLKTYNSFYNYTQLNIVEYTTTFNIINYIYTSNVFYYNNNDTYHLKLLANIKRYYNFYSEIEAPSTIILDNPVQNISYTSSGDNNKNIILNSYIDFLSRNPYGSYYEYTSNIIEHTQKIYQYIDNFNILDTNFTYNIQLFDKYSIYNFINQYTKIENFYILSRNIYYKPHLILQNNINFDNNDPKNIGTVTKIYGKNRGLEFVLESDNYKKTLLNINDDILNVEKMNVKNIIIEGNIYDKYGNNMILNYSEDIYNSPFVLQSSNFILYTSNYSIYSMSNINFILQGNNYNGITITKENIDNSDYELLRINEKQNTSFIIKKGGKIGIKNNNPLYELDVNGDILTKKLISLELYGNGENITKVNLSDRSTNLLKEGSNLYYTASRVGIIAFSSNQQTSNYITNISNYLNNYITLLNTNTSNYILNTSNLLLNQINQTSNIITSNVINLNYNMSNYLLNISNILLNNFTILNNNTSNYITNVNNNIINLGNNISNYISFTSNNINIDLINTSNDLINKINYINDSIITNTNVLLDQLIIDFNNTSNSLLISNINVEFNSSNYIINTSNDLINSINITSNSINNNLYNNNNNISNYIQKVNNDTYNFINNITTNEIEEGNNNLYYTNARFDTSLSTKTLDDIAQGSSNKFIKDNNYSLSQGQSLTISGNLFVNGNITAVGTTVQLTNQTQSNASLLISGNTDSKSLEIIRSDVGNDIIGISNINLDAPLYDIFTILPNGKVGIGTRPLNNSIYKLIIDGKVYANEFWGNGQNITNLSTSTISEGNNLYYTPSRVGNIVTSSNINVSNYIDFVYLDLNSKKQNNITGTASSITNDSLAANRVMITNNLNKAAVSSILNTELDTLSGSTTNINLNFIYTSNSITNLRDNKLNKSGFTGSRVLITDNNGNITTSNNIDTIELGYLDGTTTNINTNFINTSNWITNLRDTKLNSSGFTGAKVLITDNNGNIITSNNINTLELGYLSGVTNSIQGQFNSSNIYILNTSNNLINYTSNNILSTSNKIIEQIIILDKSVSNYILDTSNIFVNLLNVSMTNNTLISIQGIYNSNYTDIKFLQIYNNFTDRFTTNETNISSLNTNFINTSNWITNLRDTKLNNSGFIGSRVLITDINGNIITSNNIDITELGYLDGTTTNINTNFINTSNWITNLRDTKLNRSGFTSSRVLITDINGNITTSNNIDITELGYLDGTTSNINNNFINTSNWIANLRDTKEPLISLGATQYALINGIDGKVSVNTSVTKARLETLSDISTSQTIQTNFNNTSNWIANLRDIKINSSGFIANRVLITDNNGNIITSNNIDTTELGYLDGTTSNINSNFINTSNWIANLRDTKLNSSGFTGNRVLITDNNGNITTSNNIDIIELGYLDGTTTNINTNFINTSNWVANLRDNKEPLISLGSTQYALINGLDGKVTISTTPSSKLEYLNNINSDINTLINGKEPLITLGATQYALINGIDGKVSVNTSVTKARLETLSDISTTQTIQTNFNNTSNWIANLRDIKLNKSGFTATRVLITDINGNITTSNNIDTIELGYLDGTTSNINNNFINTSNWIANLRDTKEPLISLGATQYALINGIDGKVAVNTSVTKAKLETLSDISTTQTIQTNFNNTSNWIKSQWTSGSGLIYYNGNVGIGSNYAPVKLYVNGDFCTTGDITAYYSDERLKTITSNIKNPLEIIKELNGFYYFPNELAHNNGIKHNKQEIGISAQDVQKVLPEIVSLAPFDMIRNEFGELVSKSGENYLTISYERLVPVLIECVKELKINIKELNEDIKELKNEINILKLHKE